MSNVKSRIEKIEAAQREAVIKKTAALLDQLSDEHYGQLITACKAFVSDPHYQITSEQAEAYEAFDKLGGWEMVETLAGIEARAQ